MGGIPLAVLKDQLIETLPKEEKQAEPLQLRNIPRKLRASDEADVASKTYDSTTNTKKTISLEELKKKVEGLNIKPEILKEI